MQQIQDPPLASALFSDVRWAWIWVVLRVYVGWTWLSEGIGKAQTPGWVGAHAGSFLTIWITKALTKTQGPYPDVQGWYGWFLSAIVLPHTVFWSYLVTGGEICVGAALILGLFTGIAAFLGTTMNASYLLAGTVSTNPMLFAFGTLLVLAWKTAGWWGLDRYVLAQLGTPWQRPHDILDRAPAGSTARAVNSDTREVSLQAYSTCPFSVAQEYAVDYLRRAEAGTKGAEIRVPVVFWAGLIRRHVTISFGLHYDVVEAGRQHDEIRLRWTTGTRLLPGFHGTLRFRIAGKGTNVLISGSYRIPFGRCGRIFDNIAGRHLATASLGDLARRIAGSLELSERDWLTKLELSSQNH